MNMCFPSQYENGNLQQSNRDIWMVKGMGESLKTKRDVKSKIRESIAKGRPHEKWK